MPQITGTTRATDCVCTSRVYAGPSPQAPVVLCLHGLMRNGRDFAALATHLAQRHRVLVPDVRGRGLSARDPDSSRYRIDTYLEDVQELLRGLGVTQLAVIGTSMGGLMGMMLGWLQPGLVTALVLNDVGPQLDPRGLERIRGYAGRALRSAAGQRRWPRCVTPTALRGQTCRRRAGRRWRA